MCYKQIGTHLKCFGSNCGYNEGTNCENYDKLAEMLSPQWNHRDRDEELLPETLQGMDVGINDDIYAHVISSGNLEQMKCLAEELKLLPAYTNGESALGRAVESKNITATAFLYKHMRKFYYEDVLKNFYPDAAHVSQLVLSFQKEEKDVGSFVKDFLKSGDGLNTDENTELLAELLLHPVFFQDEDYNNVYLYTARYSSMDTISYIFTQMQILLGDFKGYFDNDIKYSISTKEEDVLSILEKYQTAKNSVWYEKFKKGFPKNGYIPPEKGRNIGVPPTNDTMQRSQLLLNYLIENKEGTLGILQQIDIKGYGDVQKDLLQSAIAEHIKAIPLNDEKKRIAWAEVLSLKAIAHPYAREPKLRTGCEKLRYQRNMSSNRRGQMLRHIGTQFFYLWKNQKKIRLKEVQVMQVRQGDGLMIFVAFNSTEKDAAQKIKDHGSAMKSSRTSLLQLLQSDYSSDIAWSMHRSRRYSKKIKSRIRNEDNNRLAEVLNQPPDVIKNLDTFKYKMNKVYILCLRDQLEKGIHAEEILCDTADKLRKLFSPKFEFSIFGRKRPCISCSGRMRVAEIDFYNKNPGYFWVEGIKHQSEEAARETLRILMTKVPNVTIEWGTRMKDYDTASDSD